MSAKRRATPRSLLARAPAWVAVLIVLGGASGAVIALANVPAHLAESAALDRGLCGNGVSEPCAQVDTGRVGEPEPGGRKTSTLSWPVYVAGERVIVAVPDRSGSHVERGDQVEVWRYDGKPLALVADGGERFEVGLMGGAGLAALVSGAGVLAAIAAAGVAQLLARRGSRSMLVGGLQATAMAIGIPFCVALVIALLVDRAGG